MRRQRFSLPTLALALLLLPAPLFAFWPNWSFGTGSSTHEQMTRLELVELDEEFFGVSTPTREMWKAIAEITEANAQVDVDHKHDHPWHCDGEGIPACRALIAASVDTIPGLVRDHRIDLARQQLGSALHTLQDFYSHSNWIEAGNSGALPALWRPELPLPSLAPLTLATCQACADDDCSDNLLTSLLTSGYFSSQNHPPPSGVDKCGHGGLGDFSATPDGGINKDSTLAVFSPHYFDHGGAASSARAATEAYLRAVAGRLSQKELRRLLGYGGPPLAFAVDTTGSMGDVIAGVRTRLLQIVDERVGTPDEPPFYVLSEFNDPFIGPLTVTEDVNEFRAAILGLGASGGGDCPELAMAGQIAALDALESFGGGGQLWVFTDASALDASRFGEVVAAASVNRVQIYHGLFGTCGLRAGQEPGPELTAAVDPVFEEVSRTTGGQAYRLSRSEAEEATGIVDQVARTRAVDLLSITADLGGLERVEGVPVDGSLERVVFSLSGSSQLEVRRPDKSIVLPGDKGVEIIELSTGVSISVLQPPVGNWSARFSGFSVGLKVSGEGDLSFDRFDVVETSGEAHPGLFPAPGSPVAGLRQAIFGAMTGPLGQATFELRSPAGDLLQTIVLPRLASGDASLYYGEITMPTTAFIVRARGTDDTGAAFVRSLAKEVLPQTLQVSPPVPVALVPGTTVRYPFEVKNLGDSATISIQARDTGNYLTAVSPTTLSLAKNKKGKVTVTLSIPAGAPAGGLHTLTLLVSNTANSASRNFAVVESQIAGSPK